MSEPERYPWLWDVPMDAAAFRRILSGESAQHGRDWRWALVRLIEYAPYQDICRLLPVERFLAGWPEIAGRIRSETRREGMEFLRSELLKRRRGG